ncbi:hypothetical protein P4N68_00810 [Corynebacterium felinum]|nr:hypothetical protein [Corynebacterium felinum]
MNAPAPLKKTEDQPLLWPELSWDPTALKPICPLPEGLSHEQVVWSYIQSRYHWEKEANKRLNEENSNFDRELELGVDIAMLHLTDKKRASLGGAIGWPPKFSPGYELLGVSQVKPSRIEIHVKHPQPTNFNKEYQWIFVCLKKRSVAY